VYVVVKDVYLDSKDCSGGRRREEYGTDAINMIQRQASKFYIYTIPKSTTRA
jgi:hypothetical protein